MDRPIFIVGTMRSGSTMFRLVLDSHPNIAISDETGFMGAVSATTSIPNWQFGREWYGRLGWTPDELDERIRQFYAGMFERHAAAQGKGRWGEKTPFHSWHVPEMARIFPDAVFVAIVRHPAAVVSSLRKRFHYELREATSYWESTNTEILRHGGGLGDRFAMIRYEDLVGSTEPTMRALLELLGEPWSDDVLRHNDVQVAKGAPKLSSGSTRPGDPIRADRAGRWSGSMSREDLDVVMAETGSLAAFLGYTPDGVEDGASLGLDVPLTGDALAARQREWRSRVSFAARSRDIVAAEIGQEELLKRLRQAETSLARIRSRRIVRLTDAVRRTQRRALQLRPRDLVSRGPHH